MWLLVIALLVLFLALVAWGYYRQTYETPEVRNWRRLREWGERTRKDLSLRTIECPMTQQK